MGQNPKPATWTSASGKGKQGGAAHKPGQDTDSEAAETPVRKHSPHGLPISPTDYERLKSRARYDKIEKPSTAQQDPSVTEENSD